MQDKEQVADIDPTMIIEDDLYEESIEPCMVCHSFGEDSQLLLCDGCDKTCHTHCADLDSVPIGMFFCYECREDPTSVPSNGRGRASSRRQPDRGRGTRGGPRTLAWERVWLSVRNQLNFDLDFPFDDEDVVAQQQIEAQLEQERRDFNFFQRRFRVAERQGAASRFRSAAATMLRDPPREPPRPESQEELRAWNAFEKARAIRQGSTAETGRSRKRKSTTASPSSPRAEQPERQLKRPRTKRHQELGESNEPIAESSAAVLVPHRALVPRRPKEANGELGGPNFLQSLLKEVETSPPATSPGISDQNENGGLGLERSASPDISPEGSNANSPRAHTPPPHISPRPSSPTPLTLNIMPIFPAAPEYTPKQTTSDDENENVRSRQKKKNLNSPIASPPSSRQNSPTRTPLSYSTKSEIQRMVSAALKPRYQKQEISKDEYTDINRDVSRLLYEKVGDAAGLAEQKTRDDLQRAAETEVETAVKTLREPSETETSTT